MHKLLAMNMGGTGLQEHFRHFVPHNLVRDSVFSTECYEHILMYQYKHSDV